MTATARNERVDADTVRATVSLPDLAALYHVDLKKHGREWKGLCPFHAERTPSFTIFSKGGRQFFKCFGCQESGDAIGFVMKMDGVDFSEALGRLADKTGLNDPKARQRAIERAARRRTQQAEREAREAAGRVKTARELWHLCRPAGGTLVETYLASRGIDADALGGIPPSIRFHPALWHNETRACYPAMVAAVQNVGGRIVGVHRTWLSSDGGGKADIAPQKAMFGPCWGGAVRFGPATETLLTTEGMETGLSVVFALRAADCPLTLFPKNASVWAALSLGNIAGGGLGNGPRRAPDDPRREQSRRLPSPVPDMTRPGLLLPAIVRKEIHCADGDGKDPAAAEMLIARTAARRRADGRRFNAVKPPPGTDFNDLLRRAS